MIRNQLLLSVIFLCGLPAISAAQFAPPSGEIADMVFGSMPTSARCLGMGGACTALANDVDMLTANPAGVAGIDNTTFDFQLRYDDLEAVFLDQDALNSEFLGARPGQLYKPLNDQPVNIAFAGVSRPFGQWTVSAFYQQRLEFKGGLDIEEVVDIPGDRLFSNRNALSISRRSLGISAAYQISEAWSIGLSAVYTELDLQTEDSWQLSSLSGNPVLQSDFDAVLLGNQINDKATDNLFQFGLLYQPVGKFSAGLAYSQGGKFKLSSQSVQQFTQNGVVLDLSAPAGTTISLPDSLIAGIAWHFSSSMMLSLDIERIGHSDLPQVRDQTLGLNLSAAHLTEPIKDTISVKLGFEKLFSGRKNSANRYAVRLGAFTEEDHDGLSLVGGSDTHFTLGFGAIFDRNTRFKLDVGIEFGDEEKTMLTSLRYALR